MTARRPFAPLTGEVRNMLRARTAAKRVDIALTRHLDQGRCRAQLTDGQEVRRG
jgi:hypothetical protein